MKAGYVDYISNDKCFYIFPRKLDNILLSTSGISTFKVFNALQQQIINWLKINRDCPVEVWDPFSSNDSNTTITVEIYRLINFPLTPCRLLFRPTIKEDNLPTTTKQIQRIILPSGSRLGDLLASLTKLGNHYYYAHCPPIHTYFYQVDRLIPDTEQFQLIRLHSQKHREGNLTRPFSIC